MQLPDWPNLHAMNRMWRAWMAAHSRFSTPETIDVLRYARNETAEAADAEMRDRLSTHPRNNAGKLTVHQELGDVLMLVLTALPEIIPSMLETPRDMPISLDLICDIANGSVMEHLQDFVYWISLTHCLLATIAAYPGMDVSTELRQCWWRLAWKHASESVHLYPQELKPVGVMP